MTDTNQNKIKLEKHLNKQALQKLQGLRNVYQTSFAITILDSFRQMVQSVKNIL